jgi:hypothetical protein
VTTPDPDLRAWAARLVADWPLPSVEQADLLKRTYGRVQLDTPQAPAAPTADAA